MRGNVGVKDVPHDGATIAATVIAAAQAMQNPATIRFERAIQRGPSKAKKKTSETSLHSMPPRGRGTSPSGSSVRPRTVPRFQAKLPNTAQFSNTTIATASQKPG